MSRIRTITTIDLDDNTTVEFHVHHDEVDGTTSWTLDGSKVLGATVYLNGTPDQLRAFGERLIREASAEETRRLTVDTDAEVAHV